MKKHLLKTLLVAAGLCAGSMSAWANETASNTDGAWWSGFTSTYALPGENGVYHFTFTATTLEDGEGNNASWHGWFLVATDGKDSHGHGGTEYFVMRNDGYSWGQSTNSNDDPTNFVVTDTYATNNPSGSGRENAMNNATVNMTITRSSGNVTVLAEVTPTTDGENPYTTQMEYKFANATAENMGLFFGVQWGTITLTSAYAENGTVTSTQYGCNFENGETLFTNVDRTSIKNENDATLNSNVLSITTSDRAANAFGFAKYDLASTLSNATAVDVSFDMYMSNNNANYHKIFAIGDGSKRVNAKNAYSGKGTIFYVGLVRSSSSNGFCINGTKNNTTDYFDTWIHVDVSIDFETKKVSYAVKDISQTTTYYSGSNINFADQDVDLVSQIDYYACINSITDKLDNLVITKHVDSSKVKYTLNAVDSESNVLDEISSGWVTTGTNVYYNKYIEVDGKYYETSAITFNKTINSAATYTVTYSPSLVTQYVEATSSNWGTSAYTGISSGDAINFSGGKSYRGASGNKTLLTVAEDGIYSLIFAVCNQNTNKTPVLSVYKNSASDENKLAEYNINMSYKYVQTAGTGLKTIENLSLSAGDNIILSPGTDNNTLIALDYVALAKTAEIKKISTAGWATLYTPYALDFSEVEGLTAYTATCENSIVTLRQVDDVPANTGVVLKGDAGTYNIPVATSSSTAQGELEGSATDDLAYENFTDGYTYYVLTTVNEGAQVQFNPVTSGTIKAGKAYLKISNGSSAGALKVVFADEEVTGITEVQSEKETSNEVFNLAGQRVANPGKGLFIVNGKKVVVK